MIVAENPRARLLKQHVRRQGKNLLPRSHDLAHGNVAQLQGAVHQHLLKLGQQAQAARRGRNQLQLLSGVDGRGALRCREYRIRAKPSAADRLSRRTAGRATAINTSMGGAMATASASARRRASDFRHQLAGHHVKIGDQRKAEHHGGHMRIDLRVGQRAHPARQNLRGQRLAQPAKRQRAKRHAKLHGGQQIVEIALQPPHRPRSGTPAASSCSTRVSRMETSANSAATK